MITKIQKWGNSQGLRFPRQILREAHMDVGDSVDVLIHHGDIVVRSVSPSRGKYRLKDLLAKLPANYKPVEVNWGKAVGREVW